MGMEIAGMKIDSLSRKEVFEKIDGFLTDGLQHYCVLPYSGFVVRANRDEEFRRIINQADLSLCDGRGLMMVSCLFGYPIKEQIAGVDLVREICQRYSKVFLFGSSSEVVMKTASLFNVDSSDGYSDPLEKINQVKPEILFVGLGMPKQEKWIVKNLKKMPSVKLAVAVGGSFDFISGRIRRAPKIFQVSGLEWTWRLVRQPWRIGRVFNALVIFPWLIVKDYLRD